MNETGISILSLLLSNEGEPISSRYIADALDLSLSTVRKEISSVNKELVSYGVHIDSRQSLGNEIVIDDEATAGKRFERLKYEIRRRSFNFNSKNYRRDFILRKLLISDSYVPIETLKDEMFFSSSTILRSINDAQWGLSRYGLEVKSKKNNGFYIAGDEFSRRVYMLTQHKKFMQLDKEKKEQETMFSNYFLTGSHEYSMINQTILRILKKYPQFEYSFINLPKLSNYIILCKYRMKYSKSITFTEEQIAIIHQEHAYELSKEILESLTYFLEFRSIEQEIYSFAQLLLGLRSLYDKNQISVTRWNRIYPEFRKYLLDLAEYEQFPAFLVTEDLINRFVLCMESSIFHMTMKVPYDMEIFYPLQNTRGILPDFLCTLMTLYLKQTGEFVEQTYFNNFKYLFLSVMENAEKKHIRQRICIVSMYGINYARTVTQALTKNYAKFIDRLDIREVTALSTQNLNKEYDYIFTDMHTEFFSEYTNVISVDFSRTEKFNALIEAVIADEIRVMRAGVLSDQIRHTDLSSKDEVYTYLADMIREQIPDRDAFISDLKIREKKITCETVGQIAFVTTNDLELPHSQVHLMINNHPFNWNRYPVQVIVFYYRARREKNFFTMHNLLNQLLNINIHDLLSVHNKEELLNLLPTEIKKEMHTHLLFVFSRHQRLPDCSSASHRHR